MTPTLSARIDEAVAHVRTRSPLVPRLAVVLGSGLGAFARSVERAVRVPFASIPHFAASTVQGHAGELVLGHLGGVPTAVLSGRLHLYEGYSAQEVAFPVRVAHRLGAPVLVVTNASGSANVTFKPGELMLIQDQINLTGQNPLTGPHEPALGERFVDMTEPYDPELLKMAEKIAWKAGIEVRKGVYVGFHGPSYETAAEVRMARTMGGDAVGMSTVLEVIAARQAGMRVLGVSCLTNAAAGVSKQKLDHAAVLAAAGKANGAIVELLALLAQEIAREPQP
jgi:purine-nucleoside phosphorylase